mgnify:CR=1 FL=1
MAYYFLSIGGSGAKVMESLLHLSVAGILPEGREPLKIFSVDPDTGNGNLDRMSIALRNFEEFQKLSVGNDTPLFKNKISIIKPYPWNPTRHDTTLDDMMAYPMYRGKPIGALYEVLFTAKERNTRLNQGFRGHPSIGAAVLAQNYVLLTERKQWDDLFYNLKTDQNSKTKIFIAGSVFGGTGAAGLPTVSRLLKSQAEEDGYRISIGGALMLPYFDFTPEGSSNELFARSEEFLINTKAALKYYSQRDNVFDTMYLIGDSSTAHVKKFSVGAREQVNDSHIVELYAALAAIDFFQNEPDGYGTNFKYICHGDDKNISFNWNDFPSVYDDKKNFRNLFVKFTRFIFAYVHLIKPVLNRLIAGDLPDYQYPWFIDMLKDEEIETRAQKNFDDYVESFVTWLKQIETLDGRSINLINSNMFSANSARLTDINAFKNCDNGTAELDLHEIWYRLCEPPKRNYPDAKGFGKFLRRLYDACEV